MTYCNHERVGVVLNESARADWESKNYKALAAIAPFNTEATCDRPACIDRATRRVAAFCNERAVLVLDEDGSVSL